MDNKFSDRDAFLNYLKANGLYNFFVNKLVVRLTNFSYLGKNYIGECPDPDYIPSGECQVDWGTVPIYEYEYEYDVNIIINNSNIKTYQKTTITNNRHLSGDYIISYAENDVPRDIKISRNVLDFLDDEVLNVVSKYYTNKELIELYKQREKINLLINEKENILNKKIY